MASAISEDIDNTSILLLFLIYYGIFRIISEFFRQPDPQLGYLFNLFSMGTLLSFLMIIAGLVILNFFRKKNET